MGRSCHDLPMGAAPGSGVTDEALQDLIEDYVLGEVLEERRQEEPEPWYEANEDM